MNLHKLPPAERPRERLLYQGVQALSLAELIAILLTCGTKQKSVLELAHEIVAHFGSLEALIDASIEELMQVKGVGQAKALLLKAALGIAQRASRTPFSPDDVIDSRKAYGLVRESLSDQKQEMLWVILKNVKGRLITVEQVSIGTLSEVLIHPREVFFPAVRHKANSLILVHNHPSGDPTPSGVDLKLTQLLVHSSRIMGIALDDHLIVGKNSFTSLKEAGYL